MVIIVRDERNIEEFLSHDESFIKEVELMEGWQEKMLATGTFHSKDNNRIYSVEQIEQIFKSEGFIKWLGVRQRSL